MSRSLEPSGTVREDTVEKVVAIITRSSGSGTELLVFRHRYSGAQLPAGTVERAEPVALALLREVREETGLDHVVVERKLALLDERLPPNDLMVTERVVPRSLPDPNAPAVPGVVRRGMGFHCWEERDGYARIAYRPGDMASAGSEEADVQAWIPSTAVSRRVRRHVFHLRPADDTPPQWLVRDAEVEPRLDFLVYWVPLASELGLHPVQESWLRAGLQALDRAGG